jgi:hypothetical protein
LVAIADAVLDASSANAKFPIARYNFDISMSAGKKELS